MWSKGWFRTVSIIVRRVAMNGLVFGLNFENKCCMQKCG